jgi:hypothetical protein
MSCWAVAEPTTFLYLWYCSSVFQSNSPEKRDCLRLWFISLYSREQLSARLISLCFCSSFVGTSLKVLVLLKRTAYLLHNECDIAGRLQTPVYYPHTLFAPSFFPFLVFKLPAIHPRPKRTGAFLLILCKLLNLLDK